MLKKIWQWIVLSSADPKKTSLFIKGVLTSAVAYILFFSGLVHINLAETDINTIIESITTIIELFLSLVAAWMTLTGIVRKIAKTIMGTNEVIAAQRAGSI